MLLRRLQSSFVSVMAAMGITILSRAACTGVPSRADSSNLLRGKSPLAGPRQQMCLREKASAVAMVLAW